MKTIDHPMFYLAFTEGWGDEDIVECTPIAESSQNQRLVLCLISPSIFIEGRFLDDHRDRHFDRVFLYDRFSSERWLPLVGETNVGVLVGQGDHWKEPDVPNLQLVFWATVFLKREEAERAREVLRGGSETTKRT